MMTYFPDEKPLPHAVRWVGLASVFLAGAALLVWWTLVPLWRNRRDVAVREIEDHYPDLGQSFRAAALLAESEAMDRTDEQMLPKMEEPPPQIPPAQALGDMARELEKLADEEQQLAQPARAHAGAVELRARQERARAVV